MQSRSLMTLFVFTSVLLLSTGATFAADNSKEPGTLLREGTWDGDVGSFLIPDALVGIKPAAWPLDGWMRLTVRADRIEVEPVLTPQRSTPQFLKSILAQIDGDASGAGAQQPPQLSTPGEPLDRLYLRAPGATLKAGVALVYRFGNGTGGLRPKLDYRYELSLGSQLFAVTVQNGLRSKTGAIYGSGAQYTIEYDGLKFEYSLGEYGWDSTISAIADLDGDGKPDFLISVGGNNSSYEAVLLSSAARPGKNPATASLRAVGC